MTSVSEEERATGSECMVVIVSAEEKGVERKKLKLRKDVAWEELKHHLSLLLDGDQAENEKAWAYLYVNLETKRREVLETDATLWDLVCTTEKHTLFDEYHGSSTPQYYPAIRLFAVNIEKLQRQTKELQAVEPDAAWLDLRNRLMSVVEEDDSSVRPFVEWADQLNTDQRLRYGLVQDESGSTLLHLAVSCDLPRIVGVLSQVVDPLVLNNNGLSCLHVGIIAKNESSVSALLSSLSPKVALAALSQPVAKSSGSRLVAIATQGQTALDLSSSQRITELLLAYQTPSLVD